MIDLLCQIDTAKTSLLIELLIEVKLFIITLVVALNEIAERVEGKFWTLTSKQEDNSESIHLLESKVKEEPPSLE